MSGSKVIDQRDPGVVAWLQRELDKIEQLAMAAADKFWKYHYESRVEESLDKWSTYGCRVRRGTAAIKIEWRYIYYVGPKGKRRIMSKNIPLGGAQRYTPRVFSKASERELDEIMEAERVFTEVRKLSEALTKVLRHVDGYGYVREAVEERMGYRLGEVVETDS